jgi:CobQ/CobB/MinD/ParA nucleotide binding domain
MRITGDIALPIHDRSRVPAGLYHDFHQSWSIRLKDALNSGRLPKGVAALVEQRAGPKESDVLAIACFRSAGSGGAGKTTIGIHLAVAAEKRGMKTALFDLDPQASASSWSDKRKQPYPAVVSAQAARLPGLFEQAAAQSADLVSIDSAPNADAASQAAARAADLISPTEGQPSSTSQPVSARISATFCAIARANSKSALICWECPRK